MPSKKNEGTVEGFGRIEFVDLAKKLLDASVVSSNVMKARQYTPENLKYAKLPLGYLNAFIRAYKAKLNYFQMTGVKEKVKTMKSLTKKIKK